jgi:hypothetical protein
MVFLHNMDGQSGFAGPVLPFTVTVSIVKPTDFAMTVGNEVKCGGTGLVVLQQLDISNDKNYHSCQCNQVPCAIAPPRCTHFEIPQQAYHGCCLLSLR